MRGANTAVRTAAVASTIPTSVASADPAIRPREAVASAHALGVGVVPWTVNRGRALRRLAALGVNAMITDVPRSARLALAVHEQAVA